MISFAPLRPDEVAAGRELLSRYLLIIERADYICSTAQHDIIIVAARSPLPIELLLPLATSIPPRAS